MTNDDKDSVALPSSSLRRGVLLITLPLAVLGAGAAYQAIGPASASAAPQSTPSAQATAPVVSEAQQWPIANADADVGPGNAEPVLVRSP